MEAKELRLGNLIYDIDGNLGKVTSISDRSIKVDDEHVGFSDLSLKPIPLNEERLLKFGFNNDKFNNGCFKRKYNIQGDFFIFSNKTPVAVANNIESPFYYMFGGLAQSIYTVHQFQNLYFALTGEELEQVNSLDNIWLNESHELSEDVFDKIDPLSRRIIKKDIDDVQPL